jgi:hypothetical protein
MAGDLKIAITNIAATSGTTNPFGFGPLQTVFVKVTNVGDAACPIALPVGRGTGPGTAAVTFTASSVGVLPTALAPGKSQSFILQNATRDGQNAIYHGLINVTTGFTGEANRRNDLATADKMVINNPA